MSSEVMKRELRIATYMCPSHPIEVYELIAHYLEETLKLHTSLIYESRSSGPLPDRPDPFTADKVDIAFMSAAAYIKILEEKKIKHAALLEVAAIYRHTKNKLNQPGYYSDVIIHTDVKDHVKEFLDLRGCHWAYSGEDSLSGSKVVLKKLRDLGENATFFGDSLKSGSHLDTLRMVLNKRAEAGAVDANVLSYQKSRLHDGGYDLHVLDSLGPLPPYPILVNSRIDTALRKELERALLRMAATRLWGDRLSKFGIVGFAVNGPHNYESILETLEVAGKAAIGIRYY